MSLGYFATGAPAVAGFRLHTNDWNTTNTGVALTTGDAFELLPSGTPRTEVVYSANLATGGVVQKIGVKAAEHIAGDLKANMMYSSSLARMIFAFLGAETFASLGSGAYSHASEVKTNTPYVGNLAWTDNLECHDLPMTKVKGLSFEWKEGNLAQVGVSVIGKQELTDGSGLNTLSTVNAITLPTQPAIKYMLIPGQCTVRMNAASGGALGSSDVVYPSGIAVKMGREFKMRHTTRNGLLIDEPLVGAWVPIELTLSFPVYDTTAHRTLMVAMTEQKADIAFVGSSIGGGLSWKLLFEFPSVHPTTTGLPQVNSPDLLEYSISATCHRADAAPTGMSAVLNPKITLTDTTAATHLTNGA